MDVGVEATEPRLWWGAHANRRAWLCRLLALLASEGSCPAMHPAAASEVRRAAGTALLATHKAESLAVAREAAKRMLGEQRGNHALWCAYAELEAAAGSGKVRRG